MTVYSFTLPFPQYLYRNSERSILWKELSTVDILYIFACIVTQMYCLFLHGAGGILAHFKFLTLLLTSSTCALGVIWTWLLSYSMYLFHWSCSCIVLVWQNYSTFSWTKKLGTFELSILLNPCDCVVLIGLFVNNLSGRQAPAPKSLTYLWSPEYHSISVFCTNSLQAACPNSGWIWLVANSKTLRNVQNY